MTKKIVAIIFIFICTSVAWIVLGATLFARTYDSGSVASIKVESTWGAPQKQEPPSASFFTQLPKETETVENGKIVKKTWNENVPVPLPLESSRINVALDLAHRQKGLLWYSTYRVHFDGAYRFRNTSDKEQNVTFQLQFPTTRAIYDNLTFTVDNNPVLLTNQKNAAKGTMKIDAGETALLKIGYTSQGLNEWRYNFGNIDVAQVKDFNLHMTTNFKEIDFPPNTLSATEKRDTGNGWDLTWSYKNLISGY